MVNSKRRELPAAQDRRETKRLAKSAVAVAEAPSLFSKVAPALADTSPAPSSDSRGSDNSANSAGVAATVGNGPPAPVSDDGGSKEDDVMGVGEDPVGEDGMDIDAPAWPPAGVEAADEGVTREGDPGDFYMKVIAKKFRGVWHYGVITGVVTECVLDDYGGATQWRAVFEDGDTVDLLRSEDAGPGAVETPIRLVGSASAAWEDAVDFKDHFEKLLDDVRRTMVRASARHADMSSAKAADLGVDAGELLVAGIHARSQDVRAKCKCYTPVWPTQ
eukprot:jgi/Tetstr1/464780/TSEL_009526.t1